MTVYTVVDTTGTPLDTFPSWAAAARFQTAWMRENKRPATICPARIVMMEASPRRVENSKPVVALIRLIGWATSAPSRRAERAA